MAKLFSDGTVVTGILCLMALEAMLVPVMKIQWRTRSHLIALLASLAAGAALLMAFNAALHGARWQLLAQWLLLALAAHVIDVFCRIFMNPHLAGHRYEK